MATPPKKRKPLAEPFDPAMEANRRVLADREERLAKKQRVVPDLGLGLEKPAPADALEFLNDEWDRKAFGEPKTTTRLVYGPDPLLDAAPQLKDQLERYGKPDYAAATAEAILTKREFAVPDALLQTGLKKAIARFGVEEVAAAFHKRIMNIPERNVELEVDTGENGDPLLMGSNALRECVERHGRPGMAFKFLSPRCIDVLGLRGYTIVKDKNGDPVKAGTLIMGEIPWHIAEARRQKWARESEQAVQDQADAYYEGQERTLRDALAAGANVTGVRPLKPGEELSAAASESEGLVGQSRAAGITMRRGGEEVAP